MAAAPAMSLEQIVEATLQAVPLYNPVIMGIPFYILLLMFLAAITVLGGIVVWQYIYEPMKPVWGFRTASLNNTPQSIIHGMNGQIWLEPTEYVAGLFRSLRLPHMWIITVPVAGQMGKVSTTEMSDDWNIVHNIDIDYAIVEIVHRFNEHQKCETTLSPEELIKIGRYIYDWKSFERFLLDGTLDAFVPEGIKLPPFRIVDLHEIKRYLPKWNAAHFAGYINNEIAKREKKKQDEGKEMMKWAIVAGACILICAILGYVIITAAH